jgi:hypothetical protein
MVDGSWLMATTSIKNLSTAFGNGEGAMLTTDRSAAMGVIFDWTRVE